MSTKRETVLSVQGMTCPSCIRHVQGALTELDGVEEVQVRLREGKVVVKHEDDGPSIPSMIEALAEAGYEGTVA